MDIFDPTVMKKLYLPENDSNGEDNGQITVIGGSTLFHGAPILAIKTASRIVDMVFFSSPEPSIGEIAEIIKSKLLSFIWVPWNEVDAYIKKSDAVLIGPGLMRFRSEKHSVRNVIGDRSNDKLKSKRDLDEEGYRTRDITGELLKKFKTKKWVIDAGSLQTISPEWIPEGAIITPNRKEFELLFNIETKLANIKLMAKKYNCIIVAKGSETIIADPSNCVVVRGGNPGMTKGGSGDVLAGLTAGLLAKNEAFLAATSASYIQKKAAEKLYGKRGIYYNSEDLANEIPKLLHQLIR